MSLSFFVLPRKWRGHILEAEGCARKGQPGLFTNHERNGKENYLAPRSLQRSTRVSLINRLSLVVGGSQFKYWLSSLAMPVTSLGLFPYWHIGRERIWMGGACSARTKT